MSSPHIKLQLLYISLQEKLHNSSLLALSPFIATKNPYLINGRLEKSHIFQINHLAKGSKEGKEEEGKNLNLSISWIHIKDFCLWTKKTEGLQGLNLQ